MKSGTKVLIEGEPYSVIDNEYRKPGKGQATNSIKIRALKTGRVLEKTLRSGDSWEAADVEDTDMQYLYNDGQFWTLMDPNSFEQIQAGEAAMGDAAQGLKGEGERRGGGRGKSVSVRVNRGGRGDKKKKK